MIYCITGDLLYLDAVASTAVVDCGGVGYFLTLTSSAVAALPSPNEDGGVRVRLYTYMNVKEDGVDLFGFATEEERSMFCLLITVSGVGPKAAISILSLMSPEKFASAVIAGDQKAISKAPGIGTKTAARLVLELKEKLSKLYSAERASDSSDAPTADIPASDRGDAVAALSVLGYSNQEIDWALARVGDAVGTENIIKAALANLMKQ